MKDTRHDPYGDKDAIAAFEALYSAYRPQVAVYVGRRTHSIQDADDIVASTFLVAWRRLEDLRGANEPLAWLYGAARRTLLAHWRSASKATCLTARAAAQYSNPVDIVEAAVEARETLAAVVAAVLNLSESDQEMFRLVGWEQRTHTEIATILGISTAAVATRLHRARRRLRAVRQCDLC